MNDEELPPIGADDDDARWSVERGKEVADDGVGPGSSCDEPAGDEVGEAPSGSKPLGDVRGDDLADSDLPRPARSTVRPDELARHRRRRERPPGRPRRRSGRKGSMWRETLEVEMPPSLNFLSLGIGFGLGCGFCLCLMAWGFLPGSTSAPERRTSSGQPQNRGVILPAAGDEVPAPSSKTAGEQLDRADDKPAEVRKTEGDVTVDGDEAPTDRSKTDPEDADEEPPGDPAGAGV